MLTFFSSELANLRELFSDGPIDSGELQRSPPVSAAEATIHAFVRDCNYNRELRVCSIVDGRFYAV